MALVTIKPTRIDTAIAYAIAAHTDEGVENAAEALTWGADEHVLLALAAVGWLYVQLRKPQQAPLANHILTVSLVTAVLPHILKSAFDQTRPDRTGSQLSAIGMAFPFPGGPAMPFHPVMPSTWGRWRPQPACSRRRGAAQFAPSQSRFG
jgi:hypothetical protein